MDCAKSSFLTIITAVVLISVTTDLRKLQRHQYGSTVIRNAKNAAEVSIPKLLTIQDAQNLTVYEALKILGQDQMQTEDQSSNNYRVLLSFCTFPMIMTSNFWTWKMAKTSGYQTQILRADFCYSQLSGLKIWAWSHVFLAIFRVRTFGNVTIANVQKLSNTL